MAHSSKRIEAHRMDGRNSSGSVSRDTLLYHSGRAFRLLLPGHRFGGCYHPLKFGSRALARDFLSRFASTPAMRHRLWLEALHWAAYFGEGSSGHDDLAWLADAVFTGRLGLYAVVCGAVPRGEKKPAPEKQPAPATPPDAADPTPAAEIFTSALTAIIGAVAGRVPGGKIIVNAVRRGMSKKASKGLGEKESQKKAQENIGEARDPRFTPRTHGPDDMTNTKQLTEWESKVTKDNRVRVAKSKQRHKQGSSEKNRAYAEKMLRQHNKVGKPTNIVGGPLTPQEMDLWKEVLRKSGKKNHMLVHTNSETGVVRVYKQDSRGNFDPQNPISTFKLDDFEAIKKKLMEDYP